MSIALITGSSGLIGSESVNFFLDKGFEVIGIDNNLRKFFFGKDGSTSWVRNQLIKKSHNYKHFNIDIRNYEKLEKIFKKYKKIITLEDHSIIGGLSDIITNLAFKNNYKGKIITNSLKDKFIHVFSNQDDLLQAHGISLKKLIKQI